MKFVRSLIAELVPAWMLLRRSRGTLPDARGSQPDSASRRSSGEAANGSSAPAPDRDAGADRPER